MALSDIDDRIRGVPRRLAALLETPFPTVSDRPNDTYAWEWYQEFLANAPRRLISIILADYHDPEQDPPGKAETCDDYETRYRAWFQRAIAEVETQWGPAIRPPVLYGANAEGRTHPRFDDELFNFDYKTLAYWIRGARVALIHFAWQHGDGDFQLSICGCAVPYEP